MKRETALASNEDRIQRALESLHVKLEKIADTQSEFGVKLATVEGIVKAQEENLQRKLVESEAQLKLQAKDIEIADLRARGKQDTDAAGTNVKVGLLWTLLGAVLSGIAVYFLTHR